MSMTSHPLLTPLERELAILAVGAHTQCLYEIYAHSILAQKAGLSDAQVRAAAKGETPGGLSESEKVVFEFARRLVQGRGPVEEEMNDRAVEIMGRERVLILTQLVSIYSYVCLMLNAGAVGVPDEEEKGIVSG
jgi:4-carboxymuconolactone decarboxylase